MKELENKTKEKKNLWYFIRQGFGFYRNPPYVEDGLKNCLIYVPQGSSTNFYAKFKGNGNTIKEDLFHLTK